MKGCYELHRKEDTSYLEEQKLEEDFVPIFHPYDRQ